MDEKKETVIWTVTTGPFQKIPWRAARERNASRRGGQVRQAYMEGAQDHSLHQKRLVQEGSDGTIRGGPDRQCHHHGLQTS
ncbi:hypothetical protein FJTKL_04475 [Diaporthe vaccinii]|uniref:Uncharacterized protein n=1 Tax=Diaporthe vaccinii TaxID=105482 RepID=A0ABR4DT73_9PEZI